MPSIGFRLPLTTLPTLEPLEPGLIIREIWGLAFFSSRPAEAPIVEAPELAFDMDGLNMFSLALLRAAGSSAFVDRGTGWPDTVLFRSTAGIAGRVDPTGAVGAFDVSDMTSTDAS